MVGKASPKDVAFTRRYNPPFTLQNAFEAPAILRLGAPARGIPHPVAHAQRGPSRAAEGKGMPGTHAEPRGATGEHGEHGRALPSLERARR
jgi:hypothetical protein